eukprot:SAG11_NODE_14031_length_628_cov_0.846881_1_plen_50_part_01
MGCGASRASSAVDAGPASSALDLAAAQSVPDTGTNGKLAMKTSDQSASED